MPPQRSEVVKSAHRALQVIECVAQAEAGLSFSQIQAEIAAPKSSAYALINTLSGQGWLEYEEREHVYRVGLKALLVGNLFLRGSAILTHADPVLDALAAATKETTHLGRLDGTDVVYLAKRESEHPLRLFSAVGRRLPAHATALGKAILSNRTDEVVTSMLPSRLPSLTEHTVVDRALLLKELATIREEGVSLDREENAIGVSCLAVTFHRPALRDYALSCSLPTVRFDGEKRRTVATSLIVARDALEESLPL